MNDQLTWIDRIIDVTGWRHEPESGAGWEQVEAELGVALPTDFKELCRRFVPGTFMAHLDLLRPTTDHNSTSLLEWWNSIRHWVSEHDDSARAGMAWATWWQILCWQSRVGCLGGHQGVAAIGGAATSMARRERRARLRPYGAPVIQQTKRRPPRSVLAALAILIVGYATVIAYGPWTDAASVTASLIAAAVAVLLVYGLWRGNPLARGVVVLAMAGNLIFGLLQHAGMGWLRAATMAPALVVAVLLLVPPSSQRWFAGPAVDSAANPVPASDQATNIEALWEETDAGEHR